MLLTEMQKLRLANVKTANLAWRAAKREANARAKILAANEVAAFLAAQDLAVRLADDAGVPGRQIYQDGMGTSSSVALAASLARTASLAGVIQAQDHTATARFSKPLWGDDAKTWGTIMVDMVGRDWDAWKKAEGHRFRGKAHTINGGLFSHKNGLIGRGEDVNEVTTKNAYDNPVTAWLKWGPGAEEFRTWIEKNAPEFLTDEDLN